MNTKTTRIGLITTICGLNTTLDPAVRKVDNSILSVFQIDTDENANPYHISPSPNYDWYLKRLQLQIPLLPDSVALLLAGASDLVAGNLLETPRFCCIFNSVNKFLRSYNGISVDEIIEHLVESASCVHSIRGWQSILFLPSFEADPVHELAIRRAYGEPNSGLLFDTYSVSLDLADRQLAILLKAYGNLLPARCCSENVVSELAKVVYSWTSLSPSDTNAYLLHTLLRMDIRWVDTLALHLDYDQSTRTLSLFRYPSFCIAMLQSKGAIYSFASTELHPVDPRATEEEITYFLRETFVVPSTLWIIETCQKILPEHAKLRIHFIS
ncbi:hypothetical protein B7463_g8000, partial [Scytalidium lignicola]